MSKLVVRATLKELWTRIVSVSKNRKEDNVYYNGENNLYPNEIERVINNSPIAVRAAKVMAKYISGSGVLDGNSGVEIERNELPIINKKQNLNIADIFEIAGRSVSMQGGVFLWRGIGVGENGELIGKQIEVLDYKKCRITKEDDDENAGKIYFRDWDKPESKDNKATWFYPFSNSQDVILAQMKRDFKERFSDKEEFNIEKAIRSYRGQVMFLNLNPEYTYPLSTFDSVFNDSDTDFRISLYNNTQVRGGFMGKIIALTQGLDEEMSEQVSEDLAKMLGAENSGSFYHIDFAQVDDIDKVLKIEQLKPQFDDKLFTETDKRNRRNILGAANNLPSQLLYAEDGALFTSGSDTFREYKRFYSEQTEDERGALERAVNQLGFNYKIKPIGQ